MYKTHWVGIWIDSGGVHVNSKGVGDGVHFTGLQRRHVGCTDCDVGNRLLSPLPCTNLHVLSFHH
jgi:hypothetical protein